MDLTPVLARLKSQLTGFRKIGGAADLEAIGSGVVPAPAVFLLPGKEVASDIDIAGDTIQRVLARFSLVLAISNKGDAQGGGALGELEPFRDQIKAALLGWSPASGFDAVTFCSGDLLPFGNATLWWLEEFKTAYFIRRPQ